MDRLLRPLRQRIRFILRNRTRPMSVDEADERRESLARVYSIAMFLVSLTLTYVSKDLEGRSRYDPNLPRGTELARRLRRYEDKPEEYKVVKFYGFTKVDEYIYIAQDDPIIGKQLANANKVENQKA